MTAKKKKLGIGIIGSGGIARGAHIPGYLTIPDECEILAVCDVVEASARQVAEQNNIPNVFTDYRQMLAMEEIGAVSVCTPNYLHMQPTIDALNAGKHVLCEKPLAMSAKEGKKMVDAAAKAGRQLMCGQNQRFRAESDVIRKFIAAGRTGDIYYARAQALRRRGIPGWGVFTQKDKQGGGPLIDIGVHILDLTMHLMGFPKPVAVSGVTYAKFGHRDDVIGFMGQWDPKTFTVEDFASALIRLENGASIVLESSFCANIENDVMNTALLGDKGGVQLTPLKMFYEESLVYYDMTPQRLPQVNSHHREVQEFVRAVRDGKPVPVPGTQALEIMKILDAIYESSEKGREVRIR